MPDAEKTGLLIELSERLLAADGVEHVQTSCMQVKEQKFYADTAGTRTRQQRVRIHPEFTALTVDRATGSFESMRTLAPPVGRGWEYLTGAGWDWRRRAGRDPRAAAREDRRRRRSRPAATTWSSTRPTCGSPSTSRSGTPPSSTGRSATRPPTPARRSPPSTSSARLQYGSPLMNVTGDRTAEHGLSTVGWDDEGVAGQQWDIVKDGVLVGYQVDRNMARLRRAARGPTAARSPTPRATCRCSGWPTCRCSRRRTARRPRSSSPASSAASTSSATSRWSIDMQRYNFQFTGQRFYRIEDGRLAGQLRDVAYQATTTDFWGSMAAVGGPQTYVLGGAFNCGKAQPGQVAPVSHGCPTALFENVNILNTVAGGRAMSASCSRRRSSSSGRWPRRPPTGRSPSSPRARRPTCAGPATA